LVLPGNKVPVDIKDIGDPQPFMLDPMQPARNARAIHFVRPIFQHRYDLAARRWVIRPAHISNQRDRLRRPHDNGLAQARSDEIFRIADFDRAWKWRDFHCAHVKPSAVHCSAVDCYRFAFNEMATTLVA
jgi:hypothetical protein